MKNILKVIRNVLLGVVMVTYFSFIVAISTLLLNKNEYGVTQFDDNVLILVDEKISNENYSDGTLVVLETKELKDLKVGDEIFIYQPNKKDKSVEIIISEIESIHLEVDSPYVTITNNGTAWGEDFVAGVQVKTVNKLGGFLNFIESKWVFFILLIIPCFFILLYEIYLLIIAIKFDDEDEEEEVTESEKIEDLAKQLEELKKAASEGESESKKEENIDDLMAQLESLRKEYDGIEDNKEKEDEGIKVPESTGVLPVVTTEETVEIEPIEEIEKDEKEVAIEVNTTTEVVEEVEEDVVEEDIE